MDNLDQTLESFIVQAESEEGVQDKLLAAAFVVVGKHGPIYRGSAASPPSMNPTGIDFSPSTQTWVASLTKLVTATCLMQLVERSIISLEEDVRDQVPELSEMKVLKGFDDRGVPELAQNTKPITLRNLLTHTVGLGYDLADNDLRRWATCTGRSTNNLSFTWDGWNTPLKFPPGEGWLYGSAVDWASKLLSAVTGQSVGQYMRENIFDPLCMTDTSFRPTCATAETCFTRLPDRTLSHDWVPVPLDPPVESGGCGLYTTADDYGKFLAALLKSACEDGTSGVTLLRSATVDAMSRPQLNPIQHSAFTAAMMQQRESLCPWAGMDDTSRLDHGLTGVINLADIPGKRRKGSMSWVAMNNCHWWLDLQSGIAGTLVCNLVPHPDGAVNELYDQLERVVYRDLLPGLELKDCPRCHIHRSQTGDD